MLEALFEQCMCSAHLHLQRMYSAHMAIANRLFGVIGPGARGRTRVKVKIRSRVRVRSRLRNRVNVELRLS